MNKPQTIVNTELDQYSEGWACRVHPRLPPINVFLKFINTPNAGLGASCWYEYGNLFFHLYFDLTGWGSETVEVNHQSVYSNMTLPTEAWSQKIIKANHGKCISSVSIPFVVPSGNGFKKFKTTELEMVADSEITMSVFQKRFYNFKLTLQNVIAEDISFGPVP